MDPLESTLHAARRVAGLSGLGSSDLLALLREKYLLPRVQKLGSITEAIELFEAMGAIEFRTALAQLDLKKSSALLKKLDKHAAAEASEHAPDFVNRICNLAAGVTKPSAPPPRATARARPVPVVVFPDVREIYRAEGMDGVAAKLASLTLANLKALVVQQNLAAANPPGKGIPGFRKYIQLAVKEELGPRVDVFGTIASLPDTEG
jgi:hypothetical protein